MTEEKMGKEVGREPDAPPQLGTAELPPAAPPHCTQDDMCQTRFAPCDRRYPPFTHVHITPQMPHPALSGSNSSGTDGHG